MVCVEFSPPFQRKLIFRRFACGGWRIIWGWLAVAWVPYGFGAFIEAVADTSKRIENKS